MEKVTMADVAREAGVSKSTVSQFINKRFEYMGEKTKLKIEEAIDKLGYHPNYIAKSLKQKRTSMIGIIVANIMHDFSNEVSRSIEDFCNGHDLHAIVCNADDDPEKEKRYIEMLRAKQVDGLIIFPTCQNNELYERMIKEGYPVVFVDRKVENLDVFSVITDNTESTYKAIHHLIEKGHQNIAFAVQQLMVSTRRDRLKGYKQALLEAGLNINPDFILEAAIPDMKSKLEKLFSLEEKPTAIFAANDRVFLAVMDFLNEKGLKLGKNIDLIVFDNIPFAHLLETPISFIVQPASEMGKKAAELLFDQINKVEKKPKEYVFPSKMV
ncbi:LacI family transcriptional regulator [Bacillus sp. AFS077874]|uniref:LacI family DNA-binding transcriptional regulator n=1 Tax=unclassified Bacillus (in: firmicutes) TaxID=185979 RepID=UPI000BECCBF2|nr:MULTISPECIES: LacI family DNA-binding transcriptional regulator [unclassified Bacillus (in: firmicutes)]PEC50977.1 LacI family transcriptional regulator [Bacillus sp. AFS096315]PET76354.1 LacI family transcriptional regulator [Bacillus sp. AFS001701]PFM83231.1 LacI family transcriptional regulator [Bacillus sp. AFS077874]